MSNRNFKNNLEAKKYFIFSKELCENLKKNAWIQILKVIEKDFTTNSNEYTNTGINIPLIDLIFLNKFLIYPYNNTTKNGIPIWSPQERSPVLNSSISKMKLILTDSFRVSFMYDTSFTDMILFNYAYLKNNDPIHSDLYFTKWSKLAPKTMLNLCNKTEDNRFYYDLLGYNTVNKNPNGSFKAPIVKFDASNNQNTYVACSLRLINSAYDGPCITVWGVDGAPISIPFDVNTGLISYKDLENPESNLLIFDGGIPIKTIYNQMWRTDNQKVPFAFYSFGEDFNSGTSPLLKCGITKQKSKIYYIEWAPQHSMSLDKKISAGSEVAADPVFTYQTSFGIVRNLTYESPFVESVLTPNSTNIMVFQSERLSVEIKGTERPFNSINITEHPRADLKDGHNWAGQSGISLIPIPGNDKQPSFVTMRFTIPYSSSFRTTCSSSGDTHKQDDIILTPSTARVGSIPDSPTLIWFPSDNNGTTRVISSELIILMIDNAGPSSDLSNDISQDQFNVWHNSQNFNGEDLRCNEAVKKACEIDSSNPVCGCYPTYVDESSKYMKNVFSNMDKSGLINTDPWCISGSCASAIAYKPPGALASTTCSSICSSSIHANPKKYANINIDRAQILGKCQNTSSSIKSYQCLDGKGCPSGSICSLKNGKPSCIRDLSCNLDCNDDMQCLIVDDEQKCVSIDKSTENCETDLNCEKNEYCDSKFNVCLPKPKVDHIMIAGFIFCSVVVFGGGMFYLYTKVRNTSYVLNLKIYILICVIAVISSIIYYSVSKNDSESFKSPNDKCDTNGDCIASGRKCLKHKCVCKIGTNTVMCKVNNKSICENLPYLPSSTTCGTYYYTTILKGDIYGFASNATFKFDGERWQEVERIDTYQYGYSPFFPQINKYYTSFITGLNTNMCCTYNNKVYIVVPRYTYMGLRNNIDLAKNKNGDNEFAFIHVYDPDKKEPWSIIQFINDFTKLSIRKLTSSYGKEIKQEINNVCTVVVNDKLYIFGGYLGESNNDYVGVFDFIKEEFYTIPLSKFGKGLTYAPYVKAFPSNDGNIYVSGIKNIIQDNDVYGVYKFVFNKDSLISQTRVFDCPQELAVFTDNSDSLEGRPYLGGYDSYYYVSSESGTVIENISYYTKMGSSKSTNIGKVFSFKTTADAITKSPTIKDISIEIEVRDKNRFATMIGSFFPEEDPSKFITKGSPTNITYFNIESVITSFELNNFLFLVNGFGDIFRVTNHNTDKISIIPCSGLSLCGDPLYNYTFGNG
jgi:hypothetical protein